MAAFELGRGDGLAGGGKLTTRTSISPRNISPKKLSPATVSETDISPATKVSNQHLGLTRVRGHGVASNADTYALSWGWWHWNGGQWVWCWQHATHQEHVGPAGAPAAAFALRRPPYLETTYYWPDANGALRDGNGNLPGTPQQQVSVPRHSARRGHWQQTPLGQWFFVPAGMSNQAALSQTKNTKLGGCGC